MSRHGKAERRARRQAREDQAALGETWLAIRASGAFVLEGFADWDEYVQRRIVPTVRALLPGLSGEQVPEFVAETMQLAGMRRRAARQLRGRASELKNFDHNVRPGDE